MAEYLVTGGAGFIGSHLVRRLVGRGDSVRVLDNLSSGSKARLADVIERIEFHQGDLKSPEDCRRACAGAEVVFHLAAMPSVPRSVEDPAGFHANNVDGTFHLLMAARSAGCRRMVYASSSSVYGDQPGDFKDETMLPAPLSPYALNKLVGEYYGRVFFESYGFEAVSLRYFNVFGPWQDPASQYAAAIPAFVTAMLQDQSPTIYGDGEQTRDFTYVDNVVDANLLAAEVAGLGGRVMNIACGASVSINQAVRDIAEILCKKVSPKYLPPRAGDVKHSLADISLARKLLNFQPQVGFTEGLRRTIEWYQSRH